MGPTLAEVRSGNKISLGLLEVRNVLLCHVVLRLNRRECTCCAGQSIRRVDRVVHTGGHAARFASVACRHGWLEDMLDLPMAKGHCASCISSETHATHFHVCA